MIRPADTPARRIPKWTERKDSNPVSVCPSSAAKSKNRGNSINMMDHSDSL